MKTYYHVIFWISLVICLLPANTFRVISSLSPIMLLGVQFFWFLGIGGMMANSILKKEIEFESFFLPLIAIIVALNLNYFLGKQDAWFIFQLAYIAFFSAFTCNLFVVGFALLFKQIIDKLFFKNKKPLH